MGFDCCWCRKLPFQEKHVLQQGSILGNLEKIGALKRCNTDVECSEKDDDVPAVVEFGAGRGYLTQMLADCYGVKKVYLVERKSYKLKVCFSFLLCVHSVNLFSQTALVFYYV